MESLGCGVVGRFSGRETRPLRDRRGVVRGREVVLHTSSVKNRRFLTASPQGEALGAEEDGRLCGRVADCRRSGVQASNRPVGAALSESQRSESKNNMIAGGNHTIMQQ